MPSDKEENERSEVNLELVLNMLAGTATTEISKERKPKTAEQNRKVAAAGGSAAHAARRSIEAQTGKPVVSPLDAKKIKGIK